MLTQTVANSSKQDASGSTSVAKQDRPKPSGLEVRRKFGFTKKLLDKLPLPANAQRAYFYDSLTRGLALAVSPAGKKVFVLYRKVDGRPERITIGPYPDLTIEQARGKAAELNGAIARGDNPATKRRMVRDEATLGDLFATYLEYHAKPHTKSAGDYESTFNLHLHSWKLRKISEIRKTDVVSLHARIGAKSGKYTANRVTELLSAMFNKAIAWDWKGVNPASKVKRFQERQRERFLQPDELPAFWKALQEEENKTVRDYVLLSLLTGARRANVQAMRWSEINSQTATWTIPETKNGEALTVALSAPAIAILETRKEASKSQFVLPGVGESGHLIEPKSAWKRILKRAAEIQKKDWLKSHPGKAAADFEKECETAGFRDLRIHDLRRTLGSWQAAQGASLQIIGKSLGHKSLQATQVYSRLNLDPVRASVNAATDAMLLAAKTPAALLVDGNER